MTTERIKEIQSKTAYPDSISVQQALLQVWNECTTSSQTEISDEEIKAFAMGYYDNNGADYYVDLGAKWYREQLKKKQ